MQTIPTVQAIRCPNCGQPAERHYHTSNSSTRTQCPVCDYLMVICSQTGRVIEAHVSGLPTHLWRSL